VVQVRPAAAPRRAALADAADGRIRGYDVAQCRRDFTLAPLERRLVRTGLALAIPDGYEARCGPARGLALKHGVHSSQCPRHDRLRLSWRADDPMINLGTEPVAVARGTRIAQLVFQRVEVVELRGGGGAAAERAGWGRVLEHGRMSRA